MAIVAILLLATALLYACAIQGVKIVARKRMAARVRQNGCACITFDDGPHPDLTAQILDRLEKAGVQATFFLVGKNMARYPDLVQRIRRGGHEIGEHGYSHLHAWKTNPFRLAADLARSYHYFQTTCPATSSLLFRPPHGKLSLVTFAHIWWRGRTLAFWTIDPRDYAQKNPIDVAQYVGERLAPGGVVLLHDGVANREPGSGEFVTAKALDDILAAAAKKNIPLVPLGQALHPARH